MARKTGALKHIHQYRFTPYPAFRYQFRVTAQRARNGQWGCALPECSHFLPGNMPEPIGKASLCNECMSPFLLDEENMQNDSPVCSACSSGVSANELSDITAMVEAKLKSIQSQQPTMEEVVDEIEVYNPTDDEDN